MKLLLTGGSGFLGNELIGSLLSEPEVERIYCLVHHTPVRTDDARIRTVHGSAGEMDRLVLPERVDACVIVSGVMDGRGMGMKEIRDVNLGGTERAIRFCRKNNVDRICFTSTVNVRLKNRGAYARSKWEAENAVRRSGIPFTVFRPALIYGYRREKGLGVIENWINRWGAVPVFGNGRKLEQPVFVKECADIMAHYIVHGSRRDTVEIFGKEAFTYDDLCRKIGETVGKDVRLIHLPVLPFVIPLTLAERAGVSLPISVEQIGHIDQDLNGSMEEVYRETGFVPGTFEDNYREVRG